jgi:hypothetical protein
MHPDPVIRRVHACVIARVPAFLWGKPGTGKTARVAAYGRMADRYVQRWLLSRCEPIDLKPRVYHEGRVIVTEPPELDVLVEEARKVTGGVAFYDELNLATRETESAALDRIDAPPANIAVIAAGNPPTRGQAARSLGAPAANRFCHLEVDVDPEAWVAAQMTGWPEDKASLPALKKGGAEDHVRRARMLASAFIRRRPELLEDQPEDTVSAGKGWPSTRTWEYATNLYGTAAALGLEANDRYALLHGCIGSATKEFAAYCADADLIDPEEWLKNPTTDISAMRIDQTIAGLTALAHVVERNWTEKRWVAAWKVIAHVTEHQIDAALVAGEQFIMIWRAHSPKQQEGFTPPHKLMGKLAPRMAAIMAK